MEPKFFRADPGQNFFDVWRDMNYSFAYLEEEKAEYKNGPNLGIPDFTFNCYGLIIPEQKPRLVSDNRERLLWNRYIPESAWNQTLIEFDRKRKYVSTPQGSTNPTSISLLFDRKPQKNGELPMGGGCLISANWVTVGRKRGLTIFSRASESIKALLGDAYFLQVIMNEMVEQKSLKEHWRPENVSITWHTTYMSQRALYVPWFLCEFVSAQEALEYLTKKPTPLQARRLAIQKHFGRDFSNYHFQRMGWIRGMKVYDKIVSLFTERGISQEDIAVALDKAGLLRKERGGYNPLRKLDNPDRQGYKIRGGRIYREDREFTGADAHDRRKK